MLRNNTFRVVRIDNNKTVLSQQNPAFSSPKQIQSTSNLLMSPDGTTLQFTDLGAEHSNTISLQVKARNAVSTTTGRSESYTNVIAFSMTQDQQRLVTLEKLFDQKT